ncbi:MAG: hypothetical protein JNL42_15270 [Anaerolineae bacterium]|nr:hypothetical protein [Anaerolineae bacterium]
MTTLEQEIIDNFHRLDRDARRRVRALIDREVDTDEIRFDYAAWFQDVEAVRQQIRAAHDGVLPEIDVVSILRDIRDDVDE